MVDPFLPHFHGKRGEREEEWKDELFLLSRSFHLPFFFFFLTIHLINGQKFKKYEQIMPNFVLYVVNMYYAVTQFFRHATKK